MVLTLASRARRAMVLAGALALASGHSMAQAAPQVRFSTSAGDFVIEVYPDKAPKTVENFLRYVADKHYDGIIFHRVINNFMIQAGGYDTKYQERRTRPPIMHEGREALEKGGPHNVAGTVAMARTGDPHSASAQFFINVADNSRLDPSPRDFGYTAFGKVVSGMDVVNKIRAVPTGPGGPFPTDAPTTQVVINSATLVK